MKFIDIEQRLPKGRGFSDEPHRSTLIIYNEGLQVLGVIPARQSDQADNSDAA